MHTIFAQHLNNRGEIDELHMFKHSLIHLVFVIGHLHFVTTVDDVDCISSEAHGGTATVHSCEATTVDNHTLTNVGGVTVVGLCEEANTILDALEIGSWHNFVIGAG